MFQVCRFDVIFLCGKIIVFCLIVQVLPRVFVVLALNKVYVFQVVAYCNEWNVLVLAGVVCLTLA